MFLEIGPIGPCQGATRDVQIINAVLAALNVALATWLVNRRAKADKRENGKYDDGPQHRSLAARRRRHDERDSANRGRHSE